MTHACHEELEADLAQRPTGRGDLGDDLPALAPVAEHLLDATDLTLDPAQPPLQIMEGGVVELHKREYTPGGI